MMRTRFSLPIGLLLALSALRCGEAQTQPVAPAQPEPPPPTAATTAAAPTAAPTAAPSAAPSAAPTASAPAPDDRFAKVVITAQKVAGNVYMLKGEGGNIGVSVGEDGIVVIDDQFAPLAPKIRAALREITDKPVRFVINTHWHGDHTGGNAALSTEASIIAHENVRKRLASPSPPLEVGGKTVSEGKPAAPKEALPIVTFNEKLSLHVNGEEIRAVHSQNGHTDGDSIIYFTKSNVVHMGDDFVRYGFPFVDLRSGGSVKGMLATADKMIAELPPDVKIIPGHGDLGTIEDLKKFAAMLRETIKIVEGEVKKKKTLEQIQKDKPLAKYEELGKAFVTTDAFIEVIYKELKHQENAFIPH